MVKNDPHKKKDIVSKQPRASTLILPESFFVLRLLPSWQFQCSKSSQSSLRSGDFSHEPSNSSNRSSLIFVDNFATKSSSIFKMCNAPKRRQLHIFYTVANFPACNLNKPVLVITAVTINRHVQNHVVTRITRIPSACKHTDQSSINRPSPLMRRGLSVNPNPRDTNQIHVIPVT